MKLVPRKGKPQNSACRLVAWLAVAGVFGGTSTELAFAGSKTAFELRDGDRVVLLGDTLIEREQECGYVEQRLTVRFPERNVIFRNLGWSADTPSGASRASFDFDKPGMGFEKLKESVAEVQPTVVILGYGMASSLEDMQALERRTAAGHESSSQTNSARSWNCALRFKADMGRLMDAIQSLSTNQVAGHAEAWTPNETEGHAKPWTPNQAVRFVLLSPIRHEDFGPPLPDPTRHNQQLALYVKVLRELAGERKCEFISLFDLGGDGKKRRLTDNGIHLSAFGYARMAEAVAQQLGWKQNRRLEVEQAEALRLAIVKKNELYFNRWRPQNETYLFGFRKNEQGQNAKEIPKFDQLVQAQEEKIAELRRPVKEGRGEKSEVRGKRSGNKADPSPQPDMNNTGAARMLAGSPLRKGRGRSPDFAADGGKNLPAATIQDQATPLFEVAPGFEVNLYAESPLLAKPIQMNFDPQGRLWIASSSVYPQIQPGQVADDKILVLEDRNGDGYAEKSSVFADGLMIPTGVMPGDGGAYVGQGTELLHFKDSHGDGKADRKRIVLSGFGTEDTHHIVHTLRWGPDGRLYFNQSIYIHSHIETPNGVARLNSGGIWQLRPPTMELGVLLKGFCNPWGHAFDEFGQSFVTDGAGSQGISFGLPGATYFTYATMRRELKSISAGSYPKFCGLEIVRSTHFPEDWQGNAITCDFRAHRVVRFGIEEDGSGFVARELSDVMRSTNVTFRPVDVKLGPDGALYIADWSNPIIQHGEVDFRDARRDHEHGRIWRITAKGRPLVERPKLTGASNKELLDQLLSPNAFNQQQARRVLTERGVKTQRDLAQWTKGQTSEGGLLQALWMYQSIDVVEPALLLKVLEAKDGRIRAAATRVVGYWHPRLKSPLDWLAERIEDKHPRVRLEALRALATMPTARSAELVLTALDKPMDSFLDYGAWLSINDLAEPWLAAVKSGAWKADGREKQLEFALKALEPSLAKVVLAQVLQERDITRDGNGPWIELIGTAGDPALLRRLFEQVLRGGFDETAAARALEALNGAAHRGSKPGGALEEIKPLLSHSSEKLQELSIQLIGGWKLDKFIPQLIGIAGGKSTPSAVRQAAFDALREIGGEEVLLGLEPLTVKGNESAVRRQAVLALAALDSPKAAQWAVEVLLEMSNEAEATDFWRSLLTIKALTPGLARALPKTGLPANMAKAGLRVAREGGRNEPDLVWALTRGTALEDEAQMLSDVEIKQLADTVGKEGDPARGETIFRRKELACVTCHAIGGVGGKVGPDLTSIGASAPVDYLIESVLYPNRKIKEGYQSVIVETKDGSEFSGVLAREDGGQLVLRDVTDKEIVIPKNKIEKRSTGNSLMPSGLVDALNPGDRLDLYRFLSELGKPGPFDAAKGNVARAWKLLVQTVAVAQFGDEKILNTRLSETNWVSANSLVDGRLLKQELGAPVEELGRRDPQALFAAAQFQVAKDGNVRLKLNGASGSPVWIDGTPVQFNSDLNINLTAGKHTVVLKLEAKKLPEAIRAETADATFLTGDW